MNDIKDDQIINSFNRRDESAITELKARYGASCAGIARGILPDARDCEECVNDALLRLWESIPPARPTSLRAYLFTTVRNLSLIRYRKNTAEKRTADACALPLLDELVSDAGDPVDTAILADCINRFLASLSVAGREVNVKVTLSRVRSSFKEYLEKEGFPL